MKQKKRISILLDVLTAPRMEDPDLALREYMTKAVITVLLMVGFCFTLFSAAGFLAGFIPGDTVIIFFIATLLLVAGWGFANSGYWHPSSLIPPVVLIASAFYGNYIGGIGAPANLLYVLAILLTAVLRSGRDAYIALFVSLSAYASTGIGHQLGCLQQMRTSKTAFANRVGITVAVVVCITILIHFIVSQYRKAIMSYRAELEERNAAEEALSISEKKYRQLVENANSIILQVTMGGEITFWNSFAESFFGYEDWEITGKNALGTIIPESENSTAELTNRLELMMKSPGDSSSIEMENVTSDGEKVWVAWTASPIFDSEGGIAELLCVGNDITAKKLAEEEQLKLQEQLLQSQKLEAVGLLAGGMAHDFNNMLGVVIGYVDLAMSRMDPGNPVAEYLETVSEAARRSVNLIRQLLAFARKQTSVPEVFDLNSSVESSLKMLRPLIGENIELVWLPAPGECLIKMDMVQLEQILANLCLNSRDAIRDVGKITIETGSVSFDEDYCRVNAGFMPGEYILLSVGDSGSGMKRETINHIFDPFFTTKEIGKGSGLGLSTVYGIVRQNGGFINVYSEPGSGTVFKIYFPRNSESIEVDKMEISSDVPNGQGEAVLLVEDNPELLQMTAKMLEDLGYSVSPAGTAASAVLLAAKMPRVDLLLTDVVMPGMNGRDLAGRISEMHPEVKILFMSGYTSNVIFHNGILDDGINFIHKPFSLKELAGKLRRVIG